MQSCVSFIPQERAKLSKLGNIIERTLAALGGKLAPKASSNRVLITHSTDKITLDNVLWVEDVLACVKFLTSCFCSMPLHVKQRGENGATGDVKTHSLSYIFDGFANPETPFKDFLQWLLIDYYTANAGVAVITRENGEITGLWQQHAKNVMPERSAATNYELTYKVHLDSGSDVNFGMSDIFKIVNFYNTGILGNNIVDLAQGSLQTASATVKFAQDFFKQGVFSDGLLECSDVVNTNPDIDAATRAELRADFESKYAGNGKFHSVILLPKGYKWVALQQDLQKLQAVETRRFNRESICALFGVIYKLMSGETVSNEVWQSQIKLLLGHIAKIENACRCWLLTPEERQAGMYFKFNVDALTRGDLASRMSAYATASNNGIYTTNEIRRKEDLPPVEGGDELRQNSAIQSLQHSKNAGGRNDTSTGTDNNGEQKNEQNQGL